MKIGQKMALANIYCICVTSSFKTNSEYNIIIIIMSTIYNKYLYYKLNWPTITLTITIMWLKENTIQ